MASTVAGANQRMEWSDRSVFASRIDATGIEATVIEALLRAATCPTRIDHRTNSAQEAIDADIALAADLPDGGALLRLWHNRRCIVASRRQSMLARFGVARSVSEANGWPVAVRRSGGTAVVHRPGVLNISLISAESVERPTTAASYVALLNILRDAMATLGISCGYGDVPGAHCDGRYNLRWRGQKIAGTAGWATHGQTVRRVFHAALQIDGEIERDLQAIQRFEAALGEPAQYDAAAHTTLHQILAARYDPPYAVS